MKKYCVVLWEVRRDLDVSVMEYALLDTVYYLSRKKGFCYASREYLAEHMGITRMGLHKLVERMVERGFLSKTPSGKLVVTEKWEQIYSCEDSKQSLQYSKQSLHSDVNKVDKKGKQSLHNTNSISKDDTKRETWRAVTDFYLEKMTETMNGKKPIIKWAIVKKVLKETFEEDGAQGTIEALKQFFADPYVRERGYPITLYTSRVNKYRGASSYDPVKGLGVADYLKSERAKLPEKGRDEKVSNMSEAV